MARKPVPSTGSTRNPIFRLHGSIGGEPITLFLPAGSLLLGSSRRADLHVPVPGVSRLHAQLTAGPAGLAIEDLSSTNGTWLDEMQIEKADAADGSRLRFGPVAFDVEAVRGGELELAIVLDGPESEAGSRSLPSFDPEPSTLLVSEQPSPGGVWMALVEGFVRRLSADSDGDPARGAALALAFLGEGLGARGCCLVEWREAEGAVVLAGWGEMGAVPRPDADGSSRDERDFLAVCGSEPAVTAAFLARSSPSSGPSLGLVVWGEFPNRAASASLLRTLLHLVVYLDPLQLGGRPGGSLPLGGAGDAGRVGRGRGGRLAFPAGYHVGTSAPMRSLYAQMETLTSGRLPVLIAGETGVGKEWVARILHASSSRAAGPFVAVNSAAIPTDLLEAEMFGIAGRVATGVDERRGCFVAAQGGTLFLDEIAEMDTGLQAKLLRTLQEGVVRPVGGEPVEVDVWVLAATNLHLDTALEAGKLRRDLYFRLAGYLLEVPALRQIPEEIPGLVTHFLRRYVRELDKRPHGLSMAALNTLIANPWEGNVRELQNEIRRLVYAAGDGEVIDVGHLAPSLRRPPRGPDLLDRLVDAADSLEIEPLVDALEARLIRSALRASDGVKVQAAKLLGLSRNGLAKKMDRLDIRLEDLDPEP